MRRKLFAAVMCIAGFVAGCGSVSKTATTSESSSTGSKSTPAASPPPSSSIASLAGSPVTIGPPPPGTRYDAVNHSFLQRLATILGHEFESRGFHNVNVTCSSSAIDRATCKASGIGDQGQSSSGTLKVTIDRTTGKLRLVSR